jgi:hypothetical protein
LEDDSGDDEEDDEEDDDSAASATTSTTEEREEKADNNKDEEQNKAADNQDESPADTVAKSTRRPNVNARSLSDNIEKHLFEDIEANGGFQGAWRKERHAYKKLTEPKRHIYGNENLKAIRDRVYYIEHNFSQTDYLKFLHSLGVRHHIFRDEIPSPPPTQSTPPNSQGSGRHRNSQVTQSTPPNSQGSGRHRHSKVTQSTPPNSKGSERRKISKVTKPEARRSRSSSTLQQTSSEVNANLSSAGNNSEISRTTRNSSERSEGSTTSSLNINSRVVSSKLSSVGKLNLSYNMGVDADPTDPKMHVVNVKVDAEYPERHGDVYVVAFNDENIDDKVMASGFCLLINAKARDIAAGMYTARLGSNKSEVILKHPTLPECLKDKDHNSELFKNLGVLVTSCTKLVQELGYFITKAKDTSRQTQESIFKFNTELSLKYFNDGSYDGMLKKTIVPVLYDFTDDDGTTMQETEFWLIWRVFAEKTARPYNEDQPKKAKSDKDIMKKIMQRMKKAQIS